MATILPGGTGGGAVGGIPLSPPPAAQPATVTIAPVITEIGQGSTKYASAPPDGILVDCVIQNYYIKDQRLYMMPVTSPNGFKGNTLGLVQTAAPTLLWICQWTVSNFNIQPPVPNPTPSDSNWVLLDDWWQSLPIVLGGVDGNTPLYSINGTYYYAHLNPAAATNENIIYPLVPWLNTNKFPQTTRVMPSIYLTKGLSDLLNPQFVTVPGVGGAGSTTKAVAP